MHLESLPSAVACLLLFPFAAPSEAQSAPASWPHWQGPTRDGVSTETDWSAEGRPEPLWSMELGLGYSNVSIADGRLFTLGFDEEARRDVVWCLDALTGEEIWVHTFPAEILDNFHGGGTLSTPAIDEGRVYTSNRFGVVHCFDAASGEVAWMRDYADELGLRLNFHGCSSSPLVLGERLILTLSGVTLAASKASGELLWQTEDDGDGGYSNPLPFDLDGRACLLVLGGRGLAVLDLATGERLQFHEFAHTIGGVSAATPLLFGTRAFLSAAYNRGAALVELGGEEPDFVWFSRRMRNKTCACVAFQEHLYGFDESLLKCIDMQGEERWRVRGLGMGSLSLAGDRLLILSSKGELVVARASAEEYVELSRRKVLDEGVYWTPPVLVGGLVYCRNSLGRLVCLDHRGAAQPVAVARGEQQLAVPDAETLFSDHVAAIGGEQAWRARESLHVEGQLEITGAGITRTAMTLDLAAPACSLLRIAIPPHGEILRGWDGEVAWQVDPFNGNLVHEGDRLREIEDNQAFHAALDWRSIYSEWRTVARVAFADRPCWKVEALSRRGAKRTLYFDVASGLLVGRSGEKESQVVFEDWRVFEGLRLPTRVTYLRPETGEEEVRSVEKVTFDVVDRAVFARPHAIVKLLWTPEQLEAKNAEAKAKHAACLGTYVASFGPYEDADVRVEVERGDLVMTFPGQPPHVLRGPDAQGWYAGEEGSGISVRFEDLRGEQAQTMHVRRGENEVSMPRREQDD
jgi:outer membrane protein assembly factor BamB